MEATAFHDIMSDADRQAARGVSVLAGRVAPLIFAIVALAAVSIACTQQQVMEMNLGTGVNQMRADNGLKPLTIDANLSVVARERAEDMAENSYFGHLPPDDCDIRCLYSKEGIASAWVGEVIAWNTFSADQTVPATLSMWLNSPTHFSVITNQCFTRMGTGIAVAKDGKIYQVAVFEGRADGC